MVATFSTGKNIYSVDLMFSYINIYKPDSIKINVNDYVNLLNFNAWGNPLKKLYLPHDVIKNQKKYKNDYNRIMNSNLKYPIIIIKNNIIVDGMHRLSKASSNIKAYIFDDALLKKFLIDKNENYNRVDKLNISYFYRVVLSTF